MASSAAPSIKQSYSAGNCTLELTLQPSVLSQWYPKLIAEQVEFKLWMADERSPQPALLAAGDRALLQAIAQHIEHPTQAILTVGSPRNSSTKPNLPTLPDSVKLPQTLSYLQLCDLSSVLAQYQQAAKVLPVSLNLPSEIAHPSATAPSQETAPSQKTTLAPAVRQKGKLIPFPTGRRAAWASSAAVALFAIGLTTALWDKTPTSENNSVADSEFADSENSDRLRLNRSAESDLSATLPRSGPSDPSAPSRGQLPPIPNTTTPQTTPRATKPPAPTQSANRPSNSPTSPQSTNRPASEAAKPTTPSSPASSTDSSTATENTPQANESARPSRDTTIAAAPTPANRPAPNNALDRKIASVNSEADSSAADAGLPSLEPARPQPTARASSEDFSSASGAIAESAQESIASRAALSESDLSPAAIAQQETETITQVQNYFLNRWRPNENISAPLSYQLQLSSFGEVTSFSAITEGGSAYRDRLLPNSNILFPPTNSAALSNGLTLKITVTGNGQVQVEKQ